MTILTFNDDLPLYFCLKVLKRIKDSSYALTKLHQKGSGSDPSALIGTYKVPPVPSPPLTHLFLFPQRFLLNLLAQQFGVLHPLSSFQRRYFSLSLLCLMASCFSSEEPPENISISPMFLFSQEVSEAQGQCLLEGLQDPYEANRVLCLELLLQLPVERLGFNVSG